MKLFVLLLLPTCLMAQTSLIDPTVGSWSNTDLHPSGFTRIDVRRDGTNTIVHAWGSCHPTDCDLGETRAELSNGILTAVWLNGFETVRMQLIPQPDDGLAAIANHEFTDGSERKGFSEAGFFRHLHLKPESEDSKHARAILRETADAYRNLTSGYFEAIETDIKSAEKTEVRTVIRHKIWIAPGNRVRVEHSGFGESYISIDDGKSEWQVYPKANEFTSEPQAQGKFGSAPLSVFEEIDKTAGDLTFVGSENVDTADCISVRITLKPRVTQQLAIDKATHLIRRSFFDVSGQTNELIFHTVQPGADVAENLFHYDPSATKATNRTSAAQAAPQGMVGQPAPDFNLSDLDGHKIHLESLRGNVVLLDFWATWCGACRAAMPTIELLHRGLKGNLVVLGVDNETPELPRQFLRSSGYTIPTLMDDEDSAVDAYHVSRWPTTVLIDQQGKIVSYLEGVEPDELRDLLRKLGVW